MQVFITYSAVPAFASNKQATAWALRVCSMSFLRFPLELEDLYINHYDGSRPVLRNLHPDLKTAVTEALGSAMLARQDSQLAVTDMPDVLFGFHVDLPDDPFVGLREVTHGFVQEIVYANIMRASRVLQFTIPCWFYIQYSTPDAKPAGVVYGPGLQPPVLRYY